MITLNWDAIVGAEKYFIYRTDRDDKEFDKIGEVTSADTIYLDDTVTQNTYYYYYITVIKNGIESACSNIITTIDFSGLTDAKVKDDFYNKFYYNLLTNLTNVYNKDYNSIPYSTTNKFLFITDDYPTESIRIFLNSKLQTSQRYSLDSTYIYSKFKLQYGENLIDVKDNSNNILKTYRVNSNNLSLWMESISKSLISVDEETVNAKNDKFINSARYSKIYDNFGQFVNLTRQFDWTNFKYQAVVAALMKSYLLGSTDKGVKDTIKAVTGVEPYILKDFRADDLAVLKETNDIDIVNANFSDSLTGNDWQWGKNLSKTVTSYSDFNGATTKENVDLETEPGSVSVAKELLFSETFGTDMSQWTEVDTDGVIGPIAGGVLPVTAPTTQVWGDHIVYSNSNFDIYQYPITLWMTIKQTNNSCIYGFKKNTGTDYESIQYGIFFRNDNKICIVENGSTLLYETSSTWSSNYYYQIRIETTFDESSNCGKNGAKYYIRSSTTKPGLDGGAWTLLYETVTQSILTSTTYVRVLALNDLSAATEIDNVYVYKNNSYLYSSKVLDSQDDWQAVTSGITKVSDSNIDFTTDGKIQLSRKTEQGIQRASDGYGCYLSSCTGVDQGSSYYILNGTGSTANYAGWNQAGSGGGSERTIYIGINFPKSIYITYVNVSYYLYASGVSYYVSVLPRVFLGASSHSEVNVSGPPTVYMPEGSYYYPGCNPLVLNSDTSWVYARITHWVGGSGNVSLRVYGITIYGKPYNSSGTVVYRMTQPQNIDSTCTGYLQKIDNIPTDTNINSQITYSLNNLWGSYQHGTNSAFNDNGSDTITSSYIPRNARYSQETITLTGDGGFNTPYVDKLQISYTKPGLVTNRIAVSGTPGSDSVGKYTVQPSADTNILNYYKYSSDDINFVPSSGYGIQIYNNSTLPPYRYLEVTNQLNITNQKVSPKLEGYNVNFTPSAPGVLGINVAGDGVLGSQCVSLENYGVNNTIYQVVAGLTYTPYVLSAFVKSDIDENNNAKIAIKNAVKDYTVKEDIITATIDWKRFLMPFTLFENMPIQIELSKNTSTTGKVYFDNVRIDDARYMYNSNARIYIYNSEIIVNEEPITKGQSLGIDRLANYYISPLFEKSGVKLVKDSDGNLYEENVDFTVDRTNGEILWYVENPLSAETLDQNFNQTYRNASFLLRSTSGSNTSLGQTFKVSQSGKCTKISLYLLKTGSPGGTMFVTLNSDSAGTPGTLLATSNSKNCVDLDSSWGWVDFTFDTQAVLSAGTTYHLVLTGTFSLSATDYIELGASDSTAGGFVTSYDNGNLERNSSGWIQEVNCDAIFRVYEKYVLVGSEPDTGSVYYVTYAYIPKEFYTDIVDEVKPAHVNLNRKYYLGDGVSEEGHMWGQWDITEWDEPGWSE